MFAPPHDNSYSWTICVKSSAISSNEHPFDGCRDVTCVQTDTSVLVCSHSCLHLQRGTCYKCGSRVCKPKRRSNFTTLHGVTSQTKLTFIVTAVAPKLYKWVGYVRICRPGSSVGTATELRAGWSGIESRWGRDIPPFKTGPGAHPASCKLGTVSFPRVKCGRGVLLTTHPLLVLRSWYSRAIPLPTVWATPGL